MTVEHEGKTLNVQARRGVVLSTGGHTSNVNFRRMFDPRLTEEYQVSGEPYSRQTGDGEIAAMKVGASLWGLANQTVETKARSHIFEKPYAIGNQYGYPHGGGTRGENLKDSPIEALSKAIGLLVADYQNQIQVNQVGKRFVNEFATGFDWWNPCLDSNGGKGEGGGPLGHFRCGWRGPRKMDMRAALRESRWMVLQREFIARAGGEDCSKYQKRPMSGEVLEATVARYNSFVDKS